MNENSDSSAPAWLDVGLPAELSATTTALPELDATIDVPDPAQEPLEAEVVKDPAQVGRYGILAKLGEGGMGAVYLAKEGNLRRRVALKQAKGAQPEQLARFVTEAQITAQLDHPGVIPIYALEVDAAGTVAYTMKPVEGDTLGARIERAKERFDRIGYRDQELNRELDALLEAFVRVCESMNFAHERGVIHRDLKPENIMLGRHHEVYVLDWGLAKVIGAAEGEEGQEREQELGIDLGQVGEGPPAKRTLQGAIKGTPLFMAPEQAAGKIAELTPAADVYALGMILYEVVYLQHGRNATSLLEAVKRARSNTREAPPAILDDSTELHAIMARATRSEPSERYATAMDLGRDVRCVLLGDETSVLPDRGWRKLRRWISRHPQLTAIGMAATLALFGLGLGWQFQRHQVQTAEARLAAERREAALGNLVSQVSVRSGEATIRFLRIGGLTSSIAARTTEVLANDLADEAPLLPPSAFERAETAPPESVPSARYGQRRVSPRQPIGAAPPGAQGEHDLRLLRRLTGELRACFVASGVRRSETERIDAAILAHELPLEWAYVALERSGAIALFPGSTSTWGADYDPRQRAWYRQAVDAYLQRGRSRSWSAPYRDLMGQGLVVTATHVVLDDAGQVQGVAAVDVSFGELVKQLLTFSDLPGFERASLLDAQGQILLATDHEPRADERGDLILQSYPDPEVVSAVQSQRSALVRRPRPEGDEGIVVWSVLPRLGWALVVEVDADRLVQGEAPPER